MNYVQDEEEHSYAHIEQWSFFSKPSEVALWYGGGLGGHPPLESGGEVLISEIKRLFAHLQQLELLFDF